MGLKAKVIKHINDYVGKVILPITFDLQKSHKVDDYELYLNLVYEELRKSEVSDDA